MYIIHTNSLYRLRTRPLPIWCTYVNEKPNQSTFFELILWNQLQYSPWSLFCEIYRLKKGALNWKFELSKKNKGDRSNIKWIRWLRWDLVNFWPEVRSQWNHCEMVHTHCGAKATNLVFSINLHSQTPHFLKIIFLIYCVSFQKTDNITFNYDDFYSPFFDSDLVESHYF